MLVEIHTGLMRDIVARIFTGGAFGFHCNGNLEVIGSICEISFMLSVRPEMEV